MPYHLNILNRRIAPLRHRNHWICMHTIAEPDLLLLNLIYVSYSRIIILLLCLCFVGTYGFHLK
jgi:hypothetical protein